MEVYREIAGIFGAYLNCIKAGADEWKLNHNDRIYRLVDDLSGGQLELEFNFEKSRVDRLVLTGDYHCMDDAGGWDGWLSFEVVITPSLQFGYIQSFRGQTANGYQYRKYWRSLEDYLCECISFGLGLDI